tara:strand:+ start:194 stop:499 length:306 start_codon:yes stop_codon:yes gene_type:complete
MSRGIFQGNNDTGRMAPVRGIAHRLGLCNLPPTTLQAIINTSNNMFQFLLVRHKLVKPEGPTPGTQTNSLNVLVFLSLLRKMLLQEVIKTSHICGIAGGDF